MPGEDTSQHVGPGERVQGPVHDVPDPGLSAGQLVEADAAGRIDVDADGRRLLRADDLQRDDLDALGGRSGLQGGKKPDFSLAVSTSSAPLFRVAYAPILSGPQKAPYNKRKSGKSPTFSRSGRSVRAADLHSSRIYTTTGRALPASRNKWPHTTQNDHRRQSGGLGGRAAPAVGRPDTQTSAERPPRPIRARRPYSPAASGSTWPMRSLPG